MNAAELERAQKLQRLVAELETLKEECENAIKAAESGNMKRLSRFRAANVWEINQLVGKLGE